MKRDNKQNLGISPFFCREVIVDFLVRGDAVITINRSFKHYGNEVIVASIEKVMRAGIKTVVRKVAQGPVDSRV